MLPIDLRIDRAQRLLRMIEEDAPLLEMRIATLSREHQESARRLPSKVGQRPPDLAT